MACICSLHQPQTLKMFWFLFSFFSFKTGEYFSSVTDCETSKILVPHRMTNTIRRIELELVSMIRSLRLKNFLQFAYAIAIRYILSLQISQRIFPFLFVNLIFSQTKLQDIVLSLHVVTKWMNMKLDKYFNLFVKSRHFLKILQSIIIIHQNWLY